MKLRQACLLAVAVSALILGCDDEESPEPPDIGSYAPLTTPENLINNLQVSYRQGEIQEYATLLAPEFRFKLQPIDQGTVGKEYMDRTGDLAGTQALFTTPDVSEIRIALVFGGRDSTIDNSPPADSVRIRIQTTDLQVDQTNDVSWVVTDQQDMFFRKGRTANGENPAHWLMYEWHDLPTFSSPRPASARGATWGMLKNLYTVPPKDRGIR